MLTGLATDSMTERPSRDEDDCSLMAPKERKADASEADARCGHSDTDNVRGGCGCADPRRRTAESTDGQKI